MKKSWIVPNLGGWLSIANLVGFLTLMIIGENRESNIPEPLLMVLFFGLTLPIAFFWIVSAPIPYYHSFFFPFVIVINAFVWGYGIAAIVRRVQRDYQQSKKHERTGQADDP